MPFEQVYTVGAGRYTEERHHTTLNNLHDACRNVLCKLYDTDDIHIQSIDRSPGWEYQINRWNVTVTFVTGQQLLTESVDVFKYNATLDPDYVRLTMYKPKSK